MTWKHKQIKPQKARGMLFGDAWDSREWVAEQKYDGFRAIAQVCRDIARFTAGRVNKDGIYTERTEQVPHLSVAPRSLDGTVFDGEIIPSEAEVKRLIAEGGGQSKAVGSLINSGPDEARRKQAERGWVRYIVFDLLWYKGEDMRDQPLRVRREYLEQAWKEWNNPGVYLANQAANDKAAFYTQIVQSGGEGVVLKHIDHRYGDEKRWIKVKHEATADVIITGFQAAKATSKKKSGEVSATKYAEAGMIGAVVCSQWQRQDAGTDELVEVATVSGMDDALRRDITDHPKKYMRKVLKIKHNGREPTGRFRHPRWDTLRPDKNPCDCMVNPVEV